MSHSLVSRAEAHAERIAVVAPEGVFTYADLLSVSARIATGLLDPRSDLQGARVGLLVPPGWEYVAVQWGIWRAGGVMVPLPISHPPAELAYLLDDTRPEAVVVHPALLERIEQVAAERGIRLVSPTALSRADSPRPLPEVPPESPALILHTSGTTGRPKGAVLTHGNLEAQVRALVQAWEWSPDDHVLLTLPLHHVHGIVNVLLCASWSGAVCQILPRFDPVETWERLARGDLTLYMAVPTLYGRLIRSFDSTDEATRSRWAEGARACRLMVSGSAALPVPTLQRWEQITGQRLLERYGMTEIGMGLSNPLRGERRPGFVGAPLPGVEVRLVDDDDRVVAEGTPGRIQVRGPGVFGGYWGRPEEAASAFTADGWFRTGDVAVVENGSHRILGRESVDIVKTGGEKVSALEIEDALRAHAGVADCAVVGVPDPDWGERVCAAIVPTDPADPPDLDALREFAKRCLAPSKVPRDFRVLDALPRNDLGKVVKPALRDLFAPAAGRSDGAWPR